MEYCNEYEKLIHKAIQESREAEETAKDNYEMARDAAIQMECLALNFLIETAAFS